MNYREEADKLSPYLTKSRRYLHENPELSYKEYKTTEFIVEELKKLGIPVITFSDYTGCIAVIEGDKKGKTILLRGDIDALPIVEESGVDYASKTHGVMHACGHDCHGTMLLGAAHLLWKNKDKLKGTVKLLFQAGEEAFYGATYYINNGYLENIDAAAGIHIWPNIPSGTMSIEDGYRMASCDNFKMIVKGTSAHGSTPHLGCDAIVAASNIIVNIQSIVSRFKNPMQPLAVTIGTIEAGKEFNIISDKATLEGTVRTYDPETRNMAEKEIREISELTARMHGCEIELQYDRVESAIDNKDIWLNDLARKSAIKLYGENVLAHMEKVTGSEDFSYIMDKIPSSLFIFLGCYDEANGCVHPVHNGKFKVNEDILPLGAAHFAQLATDYLEITRGDNDE